MVKSLVGYNVAQGSESNLSKRKRVQQIVDIGTVIWKHCDEGVLWVMSQLTTKTMTGAVSHGRIVTKGCLWVMSQLTTKTMTGAVTRTHTHLPPTQ
jgi:hypothetical protein